MTHSLKSTLIMMLSIFAMLTSNYVSSAPGMVINSLLVKSTTVASVTAHSQTVAPDKMNHSTPECHSSGSTSTVVNAELSLTNSSAVNKHCDSGDGTIHICCTSVCSSVSYPIQITHSFSEFAPSLALHHPVKIGDKIMRLQSILRPPSA